MTNHDEALPQRKQKHTSASCHNTGEDAKRKKNPAKKRYDEGHTKQNPLDWASLHEKRPMLDRVAGTM